MKWLYLFRSTSIKTDWLLHDKIECCSDIKKHVSNYISLCCTQSILNVVIWYNI